MFNRFQLIIAILFGLVHSTTAEEIRFNRDVRLILSENCFYCHGPDSGKRAAGLRLDVESAAKEAAIVSGDADASELVARILSTDGDTIMPPPQSGRALSAAQKQTLQTWIDQGAPYESHWSLVPAQSPTIPRDDSGWSHGDMDQLVRAEMLKHNLTPSAPADRETWLRRVAFDLIGLPPSLDEIDDFLADQSPLAFERVVDRLLTSPSYGERMTADWLDVSRYSDSYGMQVDKDRRVWPFRDWVIAAFNRGTGYDQFIIEQIAGDLLPGATRDQILATTFNRLHPQECEGGSVPEEFRIESVADRTQTVATAMLGLTMECCRCHDHKYDPLTQRDFYSLSSFFDNIDEAGLYSYFTESCPTPTLALPNDKQTVALEQAEREVAVAKAALQVVDVQADFDQWQTAASALESAPAKRVDFEEPVGDQIEMVAGKVGNGGRFPGDDSLDLGVGDFDRWQPFTIALWLKVPDVKKRAVVFHRSRAWTDAASRGYELLIEDGHLQAALIHFWPGNALAVRTTEPLAIDTWVHVAVRWDGSSRAAGLSIYIDGKPAGIEVVRDNLTKHIVGNVVGGGGNQIAIGARFRDRGLTGGVVDEFIVYDRELADSEIAALHDGNEPIADLDLFKRVQSDSWRAANASLIAARKALCLVQDEVPEIMAMRELPERRQSYLLARGAYDAPSEPVSPATPSVLPPLGENNGMPDRLDLARWLTDPSNPLVARVVVNRFWQSLFGRGIVSTPEDFGSQGSPPTHPELLDWLAIDFVQSGWDTKRLLRNIVLSATYRQAATPLDSRDPENLYLASAPRYRLSAEMLRDNVLAISGLLDTTIGGEPAKPYEVEVSFKPVDRDQGRGLYRRSLYTYWKRTGPAPMLTTLDASLRDVCRVKRDVTASPLQALVMFNSPQFVEAARVLATKLNQRHGDDSAGIVVDLFRSLTGRRPTPEEHELVAGLLQRQQQRFRGAPDKASELLAIGDAPLDPDQDVANVAATTSLAISLLNFDQSLTKR